MSFIYQYWFWGGLGVILGASLCARNLVKNGMTFPMAIIILTIGTYGSLFVARILYVALFVPEMFFENFFLAIAFWQQTGTWFGVPIGGAITVIIALLIFKQPVWSNLGSFAPGTALAHVIARIGCVFEGCCYGSPTTVKWAIFSSEMNQMVHPTQIYSIVGEIFNLLVLQYLWRKPKYRIYLGPLYCIILSSHRFIAEFFRGCDLDGITLIPGLRTFQSICVFLFLTAVLIMAILKWRKQGRVIFTSGVLVLTVLLSTIWYTQNTRISRSTIEKKKGLFLVITRNLFEESIQKLGKVKKSQGYQVLVKTWQATPTSSEVKTWISNQNGKGKIQYILIVGDCGSGAFKNKKWHFPTNLHRFKKGDKTIAFPTDVLYGDLNGDGLPELPVGRLPVRNLKGLGIQIAKIKKYQSIIPTPEWYRSVIWVGAKGYRPQMQTITMKMVKQLPRWIQTRVIGNDGVSEGEDVLSQPRSFLRAMNRPAFLSIVASHGSFRSITIGESNGKKIFLSVEDVSGITSASPNGPLLFLACEAGQFNIPINKGPSLSEEFLARSGGPVTVVAATGETHPITNYYMMVKLMKAFQQNPASIGDLMLSMQEMLYTIGKKSMRELAVQDPMAKDLLRVIPEKEKYTIDVSSLLRHEVLMYQVLGDPSSELKVPWN